MYFGENSSKSEKIEHCQKLLKELTNLQESEEVVGEILDTFESFERYVINHGDSLIKPEVWVLISFLGWSKQCMALTGAEAGILRRLKSAIQSQNGKIQITSDVQTTLSELFKNWSQK